MITHIDLSARIIFSLAAVGLIGGIIYMIHQGKIKEKYALLWFPITFIIFTMGIFPNLLLDLSTLINLHYITVILLGVILMYTYILLYFTAKLSQLREDVLKLSQEIVLNKSKEPPKGEETNLSS